MLFSRCLASILAVLDGVKAVYDHHQIGKDIGELKSDLNNAQKVKIVAEFVGHDDLLRTVDRSAMVDPIPVPEGVKQGVRAINSVVSTVKHDKYEDFPEDAKKLAVRVGEDMAMNLGLRLAYIATEGGTPDEIADEYKKFFVGLSPAAIAQELGEDGEPGSVTLMSNTIKESVVGTIKGQKSSSPWITDDVVALLPELG